jgi:hypothetical protein
VKRIDENIKILHNEKPFLSGAEKIAFDNAVKNGQISFFKTSSCEVCGVTIPKGTVKKYCSEKCYVKDGGIIEKDEALPEDDDDQW